LKLNTELHEKVSKAIDGVRPYLEADGGNIELVDITDEGIVKVRLTGACGHCPMSTMTLRAGVERAIIQEVPSVRRVEAVS
jgi:Fe-S cluster biogenesis protein NfuA